MIAFEQILSDLKKADSEADRKPLMGWTCTYLPTEILEAGGLRPYRILPEPFSEKADSYLDPNFCPLIKASLGKAIEGGYSSLSGIIMVNTCDGMRRLFDAWRFYCPPSFSYLLDLPRIITPSSLAFFREKLEELTDRMGCHFNVRITEDKLAHAIEEANSTRYLIKRLLSLKERGNPSLLYGDILDILAEGWRNSRKVFNGALERLVGQLETQDHGPSHGPKLMLTGSLLDGSPLVRLVEELGAEVITTDLCTGGRLLEEVPLSSDPFHALSETYLKKTSCARMYDTERRIAHVKQEMDRSEAQGVLYFSLKFCDPYLYEAPAIRDALEQMGIPVLFVEGEYTGRLSGGIRTRVQAFVEMLERHAA